MRNAMVNAPVYRESIHTIHNGVMQYNYPLQDTVVGFYPDHNVWAIGTEAYGIMLVWKKAGKWVEIPSLPR